MRRVCLLGRAIAARRRKRRFDSVDHLGPEAIVSFVDGELSPAALHRARVHLVHCAECRLEVHAQRRTSDAVHASNMASDVTMPRDLLRRLTRIAERDVTDGPCAADIPTPRPESVIDRVETLLRALRRGR